jgi:hypothetical protein
VSAFAGAVNNTFQQVMLQSYAVELSCNQLATNETCSANPACLLRGSEVCVRVRFAGPCMRLCLPPPPCACARRSVTAWAAWQHARARGGVRQPARAPHGRPTHAQGPRPKRLPTWKSFPPRHAPRSPPRRPQTPACGTNWDRLEEPLAKAQLCEGSLAAGSLVCTWGRNESACRAVAGYNCTWADGSCQSGDILAMTQEQVGA